MREIKFRLWDKGLQKMEDWGTLYDTICVWRLDLSPVNSVFMQYIGLNDKNGKEIYEGDILQWTDGDMWKGEVKWLQGDCCFDTIPTLNGLDSIRCEQYSIIGNIYEHPNLVDNVVDNLGKSRGNTVDTD